MMVLSSCTSAMNKLELFKFYEKKYLEQDIQSSKYREEVDKYMKNLVADRQELVDEISEKDEQILNFQKALLDVQILCTKENKRFLDILAENEHLKKKEESLHDQMRKLLDMTKDKNIQDTIIYFLGDPNVNVAFQYNRMKNAELLSSPERQKFTNDLKKKIQFLQSELDVHSVVSNKSEVILADCKKALEISRITIQQDKEKIQNLNEKLAESQSHLSDINETITKQLLSSKAATHDNKKVSFSNSNNVEKDDDLHPILSAAKVIQSTLNSLSERNDYVFSLLTSIQSTDAYKQVLKLPPSHGTKGTCVSESDINELKKAVRLCTRLSYDANSVLKSLENIPIQPLEESIETEKRKLDKFLEELVVSSAESEINVLSHAQFFHHLTKVTQPFLKYGVKQETQNKAKYISEFNKIKSISKSIKNSIVKAVKVTENIIFKCQSLVEKMSNKKKLSADIDALDESDNTAKPISCSKSTLTRDKSQFENNCTENTIRTIDSTLAKISQVKKDDVMTSVDFFQNLFLDLKSVIEELNSLHDDYKTDQLQCRDSKIYEDFTKYSSAMMTKLEALADRSTGTVTYAAAHLTNQKSHLQKSNKILKDTQELLNTSINECLRLKEEFRKSEKQHERDIATITKQLTSRLNEATDIQDAQTAVQEVVSSVENRRAINDEPAHEPIMCFYCKQGSDHRSCDGKIQELNTIVRQLNTELKFVHDKYKEESRISKWCQLQLDKATSEFKHQNHDLKVNLEASESKVKSLLDQLKLMKDRLKHVERYRVSQVKGFETDVAMLRSQLKEHEKQLAKSVKIFEQNKRDEELLQTIHGSVQQSAQTAKAIVRLKAKLYQLENQIMHI